MLRGCTRARMSEYESSLGQPNAFRVENGSLTERSTELTGEGGDTIELYSTPSHFEDLTLAGKVSWEAGGLWTLEIGVKGLLKGPGGRGSMRGKGGRRRIGVSRPSCRSVSQRNVKEFSVLNLIVNTSAGPVSGGRGNSKELTAMNSAATHRFPRGLQTSCNTQK